MIDKDDEMNEPETELLSEPDLSAEAEEAADSDDGEEPVLVKSLFSSDIYRRIEEVIKVDHTDEDIIREEISEYVVTSAISGHYAAIYDAYAEARNKPTDGVSVWVSGFFGSGKSSFAKMLGLTIANRMIDGRTATERFIERTDDKKIAVLLNIIIEKIPTHAVVFDVSTDRGIRSGNQTLTEIMYGLFLKSLGYAKDLDLSELEIELEEKNELEKFEQEYRTIFKKEWSSGKGKVAFALSEASRVMHRLDPETFPAADSWVKGAKHKADITPGKLADRAGELMARRMPGHSLLFVVDEVGQFVARDVQKMLDLQAIVQQLGVKGRGKHWVVVTSQEKLGEIVSGLDDKKIELARLMDRFPLQVHLEPSDISEVTSRRVLAKNAQAQVLLGKMYNDHHGKFGSLIKFTAEIRLPKITRDAFIELYPLLPYQIELIIQIVSGLRTQGGSAKHVGGANRTIIKLAQQLLVNPSVDLASKDLGCLVRLDQVYDLVEGNIASDVRAKIASMGKMVDHPYAQSVAKVICLLQYVQSVHRTADNIASALVGSVNEASSADSVKAAIRALEQAKQIRGGKDGYRIPTPVEEDWERDRNGIDPKPSDYNRYRYEILAEFWKPQPSHNLLDARVFKGGLAIGGRELRSGDIVFHMHVVEDRAELKPLEAELRTRSQLERTSAFWVIFIHDEIVRLSMELFRSNEMLSRKAHEAAGQEASALATLERHRADSCRGRMRDKIKEAALGGQIIFRGLDRSPFASSKDVSKAASDVLAVVLPDVFQNFRFAAVKPAEAKKAMEALFTAENLQGLPTTFTELALLRDEGGKIVFNVEKGVLYEVLLRIEERATFAEMASGRYLTEEFAKEPFGWDFETVRLAVVALVRAGKVEATSKSQTIDSVSTIEAREAFTNNNLFRQATFLPMRGIEFPELIIASELFRETFGSEARELSAHAMAKRIRKEVEPFEDSVTRLIGTLSANRLPGIEVLEKFIGHIRTILRGSSREAVAALLSHHGEIGDGILRATELKAALTETSLMNVERGRNACTALWPVLVQEPDVPDEIAGIAASLEDTLARETFFKNLPAIDHGARVIENEYRKRSADALSARVGAYTNALQKLGKAPGWAGLSNERKRAIAEPFEKLRSRDDTDTPIPQLRADLDACGGRYAAALAEVRRLVDGDRVVSVSLGGYFGRGIDTVQELDNALDVMRAECVRLIGAGKKLVAE